MFDLNGNLLSSVSSTSDGYRSTWVREDRDGWHTGLIPISYALQYCHYRDADLLESSEELYSAQGWLLSMDASDREGSTRSYRLTPVMWKDGSTDGYVGLWSLTTAMGETNFWTDTFDAAMNWLAPQAEPVPEVLVSEVMLPVDPEPKLVICELPPPKPFRESENGIPREDISEGEPRSQGEIRIKSAVLEPVVCEPGLPEPAELRPTTKELRDFSVTMTSQDAPDNGNSNNRGTGDLIQVTAWVGDIPGVQPPAFPEEPGLQSDIRHLDLTKRRHRSVRKAELIGEEDLSLRGNRHDNLLIGNGGDNRIEGGRGVDICVGGAGADLFVLSGVGGTHDRLTDFNPQEDRLVLKGKYFKGLFRNGALIDGVIGNQLIWDEARQALLFDRDGATGAQQPITLALMPSFSGAELTAQDLLP